MQFAGIKIGGKKESEPKTQETNGSDNLTDQDSIEGLSGNSDILQKINSGAKVVGEEVIYGVYNNANSGWWTRWNDFMIDHSKVKLRERSYFFHMLAVMVDAGIPVVQAVKSLAYRSENQRFRRVLNTVAHECEAGANLSDAMSRFDDVFDEAEVGIVRSGEATGKLYSMLFKLSDQLDKRHDLELKLWGAAVYPISVLCVLVLVVIGMLVWIFPTLLNLLKEGGVGNGQLPMATRILITVQNVVVHFWWAVLLVIFVIYGLFSMYIHSSDGAVDWDYKKLNMPILGSLLRKLSVLRFVSLLGILVDAGLPVVNSLKITGNSISNRIYRLAVQEVIEKVKTGKKISDSLRDGEFLFPPEVVQMLAVGEATANLGKVSEKIADQYQREVDNTLKKLTSVFEPVMILVVGLFVGLLALAIMAPIFNLSSNVGA